MYLLDTNIVSYLFRQNTQVRNNLAKTLPNLVSTCSIVTTELFYGAYKRKDKIGERLKYYYTEFCQKIHIYPYDYAASEIFSKLKYDLQKQGCPIADFDLMIASICLANNLVLVTHNTKHFKNIPNLKVEDWTV